MNTSNELSSTEVNSTWTIEDAEKAYRVKRWGNGYFDIGPCGNIHVSPRYDQPDLKINLREVVNEMAESGIQFPAVIRFHDILRSQVEQLNKTFRAKMEEADYEGKYFGVFPVKNGKLAFDSVCASVKPLRTK